MNMYMYMYICIYIYTYRHTIFWQFSTGGEVFNPSLVQLQPGWRNVHSVLCKGWTRDGLVHQCPEYPECNDQCWLQWQVCFSYVVLYYPPEVENSSPLEKLPRPKRKGSSSNHHFSRAMSNFGGVCGKEERTTPNHW